MPGVCKCRQPWRHAPALQGLLTRSPQIPANAACVPGWAAPLTWPTNSLRGAMALSLIEVPTVRRGCDQGAGAKHEQAHCPGALQRRPILVAQAMPSGQTAVVRPSELPGEVFLLSCQPLHATPLLCAPAAAQLTLAKWHTSGRPLPLSSGLVPFTACIARSASAQRLNWTCCAREQAGSKQRGGETPARAGLQHSQLHAHPREEQLQPSPTPPPSGCLKLSAHVQRPLCGTGQEVPAGAGTRVPARCQQRGGGARLPCSSRGSCCRARAPG